MKMNQLQCIEWLKQHKDTHEYLKSVFDYFIKAGRISDRQINAINKFAWSYNKRGTPATVSSTPAILSGTCNIPLDCNRKTAKVLIEKYRSSNTQIDPKLLIFTYNIVSFERGANQKSIKFVLEPRIDNLSMCICCGASLTDWRSIATGVGPVCASRTGINYVSDKNDVDRFRLQLAEKFRQLGSIEWVISDVRLLRRYAKNGDVALKMIQSLFDSKTDVSTAKPPVADPVPVPEFSPIVVVIDIDSPELSYEPESRTFKYSKKLEVDKATIVNMSTGNRVSFFRVADNHFRSADKEHGDFSLISVA